MAIREQSKRFPRDIILPADINEVDNVKTTSLLGFRTKGQFISLKDWISEAISTGLITATVSSTGASTAATTSVVPILGLAGVDVQAVLTDVKTQLDANKDKRIISGAIVGSNIVFTLQDSTTITVNAAALSGVFENAGPLTGAAPTGKKWGVDTTSGQAYYVSGGNWTPVPTAAVDLNTTVSNELGGNGTGLTSPTSPSTSTPDPGDTHIEIYDDVTLYFTAVATNWTAPVVVEIPRASEASPSTQAEVTAGTAVAGKYVQPDTLKVELDKKVAILDIVDDVTTGGTSVPLSAAQGVALTAKDVASGAVTGTDIILTLNDTSTVTIDATALINDLHVQSGTYNSGTTSIDFVVSDGQTVPTLTTVSVLVSDLLASVTDATIDGNGTTASPLGLADDAVTTIKILDDAVITAKILDDAITTLKILDANVTKAKLASDVYATVISPASDDATGAIGTSDELARADHKHIAQSVSANVDNLAANDATDGLAVVLAAGMISIDPDNMLIEGTDGKLTASLDAATVGVPLTGDFVMGWSNGTLTIFPK